MNGAGVMLLILQLAVILTVTNLCGWLVARVGQPRVVGEIVGGLVLGPLLLGHTFPVVWASLFPPASLGYLDVVSNVGLVLFLFLMGLELDLDAAAKDRRASLAITAGSIVVPFGLGTLLSPFLVKRFYGGVITVQTTYVGFVLFTGIAMSITALPVLARIIRERSDANRSIDSATATTALLCAAVNDLLAWTLLALTLTLIHSGQGMAVMGGRLLGSAGYIGLMLFGVRPLLKRIFVWQQRWQPGWVWIGCMVAMAFASAKMTEVLGAHAFFGAFLAGICVPRNQPDKISFERVLQPFILVALPVFFAMTGLRMQREMFSVSALGWLAVVLLAAVAGKIGGATLAARSSGMTWERAAQIGILLNTRGLVELIVLNVGYREGIFNPLLFTVFVLMAIVTTAMTVPVFDLSERLFRRSAGHE
jgi:Kef-type K+ transport system membrane component KefB